MGLGSQSKSWLLLAQSRSRGFVSEYASSTAWIASVCASFGVRREGAHRWLYPPSAAVSTNFKAYENPSIFHRWAAAQWRRPKDPTIYGATETDEERRVFWSELCRYSGWSGTLDSLVDHE